MRRIAIPIVLATGLALGCGATDGASGSTATGLQGRVMRGPIMPVCRVNVPCDAPAKGLTLRFSRNGRVVASATTNAKGWYRVVLRPGRYSVRTNRRGPEAMPTPAVATATSGRFRRVDFHVDTGIR
ncbi:MAG TPA: hypothetical protein VFL41_07775 [Gaiellaceae bacterium]|nr:hypothetical protein [Gaiellaceae bacterium]